MSALSATLESWSAWAPGLDTRDSWERWAQGQISIGAQAKPDVSFLPAMFRRRLSPLSRMALLVANQCADEPIRTVFCSRHGELARTVTLLQALTTSELISPTAFSMSVHNTASGLYSIANNDRSITTAVAGGVDGFESAFMECAAIIASGQSDKVMLVIADEPLPASLANFEDGNPVHYAAAFVLGKSDGGMSISLSMDAEDPGVKADFPHALEFIRFILSGCQQQCLEGARFGWQWRRDAS
ncbi:beta-ketoacyl synthase chain length factor [Oceanicoccus sp. KOV_DT_Chl]|uniref:beta-ketoacyl synthase chain length factor n=1 Tax=Oceanicoccus sp. KOV_DT_Chl TaxID=1904639 RepID=UPI000C7BBD23|nr:beta-ketoacyl synthase chain length factor [Oceanicoccus sp. KOV_DT_Chl]